MIIRTDSQRNVRGQPCLARSQVPGNPRDIATTLECLVAPAMQHGNQPLTDPGRLFAAPPLQKPSSRPTLRWRGLESNFQYAGAVNLSVTLLWHESQVVIRVEELSKEELEQILYNHIRLGTQTKKVKRELKPFLPTAARIHFPPRRVERI